MTAQSLTAADILSIPIAELRERVELAERLAIASRHGSSGTGSAVASPTGTSTSTQAGAAGKPAATAAAPKPAPAATAKPATPAPAAAAKPATPPAAAAAADDDEAALGGTSVGDFTGDELTAGDDDDMLSGFVEDITPEDAKVKAVAIAKQVISKKDNSELAIARTIMQKYGVSKVSEIAAGREVELYTDFRDGFPQYAG